MSAAHIAFAAPSRRAVDAFFSAALKAGGRIHGEPAFRDQERTYYSAAVLDFDDNSIEVMHRDKTTETARSVAGKIDDPRVLSWQKDVAKSTAGPARITVNTITRPTMVISQPSLETKSSKEMSSKAIIGTLLGAAAGAVVAYAMTKAEDEGSKAAEPKIITYQTIETPTPQMIQSVVGSRRSYSQDSVSYTPKTVVQEIEYPHPPSSVAGPSAKSHQTAVSVRPLPSRTITAPSRSTLIDTFIPPSEVHRYPPRSIIPSHTDGKDRTSPSQALSSTSRHSKPHGSSSAAKTITPADFAPAQGSVVTEVKIARDLPLPESRATSMLGDGHDKGVASVLGSVAPSDSVSQAGSKKSRASGRSKRHSSSKVREDKAHGDGGTRVSETTVKNEGSRTGRKVDTVVSMPMRPSSKASVHRSVMSFLGG